MSLMTRAAKHPASSGASAKTARSRRWSGTLGFVLALSGAAIGFKTVWQFPYVASESGGGAYVLVYALFALLVGAPLLIGEVLLGRRAHASPISAVAQLAHGRSKVLWLIGAVCAVAGGFIVYSYLCVVAGWTLAYFVRSFAGVFTGLTADGVQSVFATFVKDPEKQVFWHGVFLVASLMVLIRGVQGIERVLKVAVPVLLMGVILLVAYAGAVGNLSDATTYLLEPDFSELSWPALVTACSQVLFSFGLGTGMAIMYGAYLPPTASVARASLSVVGINTVVTIVIGVALFAIVLGGGLAPTYGTDMVFQTLPLAFDHLPYGQWFATLFFGVLALIALLTAIGLVEPVIAWLIERFEWTRLHAATVVGAVAWVLGLVSIFSFNIWTFTFAFFGERTLGGFDILQILSAQIMLPLAGVLLALFIGWVLMRERVRDEWRLRAPRLFNAWLWCLRVVVPTALLAMFIGLYVYP